jgi:hypothetical protein
MKVITKMMGVLMILLISSALVSGQSSDLKKQKVMMTQDLTTDTYDGVKPVANLNDAGSNASYASSNSSKDLLWDNGSMITHPGGGFGGADASVLQSVSGPALTTYGFGAQQTAGNSMADDFMVTGTWTLTTMKFYAYQTGSTTTSTITGIYAQIWNGAPNAGGTVVWGNLTTNLLASTSFTNIYRSIETNFLASNRPIMEVVANFAGCVLSPGTYWVQYQFTGSLTSGPWAPPISIWDTGLTGNALQYTSTGWATAVSGTAPNTYAQGMPFIVEGTIGGMATNDLAVTSILAPNTGANLGSAEPVTIRIMNMGTNPQSNFPVFYTINGGAQVNGTVTATINSLATYDYTFATTANLSAYGVYNFHACTNLAGDENMANNCFDKAVENLLPSYCAASTTTEDEYIANVSCGTINNSSGWQGGVADYTAISTTINAGMSEDITVLNGPNIYSTDQVTCWVDWNLDYTFGTGDEQFVLTNVGGTGATFTGAIAVPAGTPDGNYRMRVRMTYGTAPVPCGSASYGEIEDYTIVVGQGIILDPPTNLTAVVIDNNDVLLNWTAPGGGGTGEWIQWDAGVNNGNAIGLTAGGSFWVASHWTPADLAPYNGQYLEKISFFPYQDAAATFNLYVWTGPNAGTQVLSQAIASYTVDTWNEITLTTPVMINAAQELWFGYKVTHGAGTFPAGTDDGPAVGSKGDMISLDGVAWVAMGATYGLDYNWNLAGYVVSTDGAGPSKPMVKEVSNAPSTGTFASATENGMGGNFSVKFNPSGSKALLGYNVYRNTTMAGYTAATTYTDMDVAPGTYNYTVKAVYDEGLSGPSNVATVVIEPQSGEVYCDDFEAYTVGQQLVAQNSVNWTTWSNTPGSTEDPYIVNNGTKVVEITGVNDLVYAMPDYVSGFYSMTFDLYVPTGHDAYFNTLQDFAGASSQWGMQVYFGFEMVGQGSIDGGLENAANFTFDYDTWMTIQVDVDLDNDWGEFFIDGNLIHGWIWSSGTFGTGTLNQLGGNNFYAWTAGINASALYHMDNYCLEEGEETELLPPLNLVGDDQDNDAYLDWDPPSGGGTGNLYELIQHDGNNANGYFQAFGSGYGVVYDLSGYNDVTVELVDFRHSSWGTTGTWDYKLHIVNWDTYTEIAVIGPLQTTGNDIWEEAIPLGSIPESGLVGVFMEPLGNISTDAYPCIDSDNVGPDGMSYFGPLTSYQGMALSGIGDFLMDLWIMASNKDGMVKAVKYAPNYGNGIARVASPAPSATGDLTLKQTSNGSKAVLLGYNVYRDGAAIDYVSTPITDYIDYDLNAGEYNYYVTAVYDEGESNPSNDVTVIIVGPSLPGPTNLVGPASVIQGEDIDLTWDAPGGGGWIQWDAGVNNGNGIGLTAGGTFSCASRWMPADLTNYNGLSLTAVSFFANADPAATYVIKVWSGSTGTTLLHTQNVTSFNVDEWNEVALTTPIVINAAVDFWFGYSVTHSAGTFPAGTDDGPAIPYKGDMISTGGAWVSMSTDYGLDYNWNIAGYVELADGKNTPMQPMVQNQNTATNASFSFVEGNGIAKKFNPTESKDLSGYKVYRKNPGSSTFNVIGTPVETNYTDVVNNPGQYYYYVTAVYTNPNGESGPSNTILVDVIIGIEDVIFNSTAIYPNPASDMLYIKSEFDIKSVRVFNYAGQTVANEPVDSKFYQFNTSQFNPGLYLFQIETNEGTITKRIIIE